MKYYLLHIPVNAAPILHGPLLTEVAVDLKQPDITSGLNFCEYDQLICLSVTGHGEIVRAKLRDLNNQDDEPELDELHDETSPYLTTEEYIFAPGGDLQ